MYARLSNTAKFLKHFRAKQGPPLKITFYLLLASLVLLAQGRMRLANTQIAQGGYGNVPIAGSSGSIPTSWQVANSGGTIVGSSTTPNGWNVVLGEYISVTVPAGATVATNYKATVGGPKIYGLFDVIAGNPGTAPSAPTNLTATAGVVQVSLSWGSSTGAASYTVLRSTTSGSGYASIASGLTATSYTDHSVSPNTTYYYVVTATNSSGTSGYSNQASATPFNTAPPSAPTNLTATAGSASISLSWTASTGASSYSVLRSTTSGSGYSTIASGLTSTTYTDSTATNGTYYYVVTATNTYGTSGYSNQASATVNSTPPNVPIGVQATPAEAQVTVSWVAANRATSYNVKRSTTSGGPYTTITIVSGTSYTNTGLTDYTTYFYVVSALNSAGESPNSAQASAEPPGPPPAPSLSASGMDQAVQLSWTGSLSGVTYTVQRSTTSGGPYTTLTSGLTSLNYVDGSLTNGTTYYYIVYGTSSLGDGAASNEASATPSGSGGIGFVVRSVGQTIGQPAMLAIEVLNCASTNGTSTSSQGGITYYTQWIRNYYLCSDDSLTDPITYPTVLRITRTINNIRLSGPEVGTNDDHDTMTSSSTGGQARILLVENIQASSYHVVNGQQVGDGSSNVWVITQRHLYNLVEVFPDITSLDSRKTYGQPDLAGEQPADPNAPLRSVNFYGWNYKGGLFVGNTLGTGDLSGTARIQANVSNPPSLQKPLLSSLTMAYLGHNPNLTSDLSLSLAYPASSDVNLGVTAKDANWGNAWNLSTATVQTGLSTSTMTANQYANLPATGFSPQMILALTNESTLVSQGTTCWAYFANVPWASASGLMAASDAQPRIWVVDDLGSNN